MKYAYLEEAQQQTMLENRLRDLESQYFQTSLQVTQAESQATVDDANVTNLKNSLANIDAEYEAVSKLLKDAGGAVPTRAAKASKA